MKLKDSLEIVKIGAFAIFGLYVKNMFAYITYNLIRGLDWTGSKSVSITCRRIQGKGSLERRSESKGELSS